METHKRISMGISKCCPKTEQALRQFQKEIEQRKTKGFEPRIVGIGGPGGSGKSILCAWLQQHITNSAVLSLDEFRFSRSDRPSHAPFGSHPDAVNIPLILETLIAAKAGQPVFQPNFDRISGRPLEGKELPLADVYLVDGEITAYSMLNAHLDTLILVQSSMWTQFMTRMKRDRKSRNCSLVKTLRIYVRSNLMDYPRFGKHSEARAQLVFHRCPRKGLTLLKNQL